MLSISYKLNDYYFVEASLLSYIHKDVEVVQIGKPQIVEFKWGDQLKQGGPSAATLHGPAGLLEACYLVRPDHLRRGTT